MTWPSLTWVGKRQLQWRIYFRWTPAGPEDVENDVVRGRRGVTADTALRLARFFGGDGQSWLNLQAIYELRVAEIANRKRIEREVSPMVRDFGALNPA